MSGLRKAIKNNNSKALHKAYLLNHYNYSKEYYKTNSTLENV